jgi:hypothetical protein
VPEHLKALTVILAVASAAFLFARNAVLAAGLDKQSYRDVVLSWVAVTFAAFLAHGFWFFALLVLIWFSLSGARKRNALLVYVATILAAPSYLGADIPGVGGIRYFLHIDHLRLLKLVVLVPYCLWLWRNSAPIPEGFRRADVCVALLIIYMTATTALDRSATETLRASIGWLIDIWLPYYAASRGLRELGDFRRFAMAAVLVAAVIGLLAVFETMRGWLLYESLRRPYGMPLGLYLYRGDGGPLRAFVSSGQPIVLGYFLMIALGFMIFVVHKAKSQLPWLVFSVALLAGLWATLSRGPWVGTAAMMVIYYWLGSAREQRRMIVGCLLAASVVALTPLRGYVLPYLPFVGTVEAGTIDYRQRLWEVSVGVVKENLWFGDRQYLLNPSMEQMRQGQGIIDVVNSYLQYALEFGLVGVLLFVAAAFGPTIYVFRGWRAYRAHELGEEGSRLGRVLLALSLGVAITIATASGLYSIPTFYWLIAGMGVAYGRAAAQLKDAPSARRSRALSSRAA